MTATGGEAETLEAVAGALHRTIQTGRPAPLPEGAGSFAELNTALADLTRYALALSQGDLEQSVAHRGMMAGALKALQAALRHLTWQTQRIAAGDFSQRVDFMGEFSAAFNSMVVALADARSELDERNRQLQELADRLEHLAVTDALTGAFNRRRFDELVRGELERTRRYGSPLSLVLLDVDHFKRVNDTFGHDVGDAVLIELAALIRVLMRSVDSLARWGGEEFVVLTPGVGGAACVGFAERVRESLGAHVFPGAGHVAASFVVAEYELGDTEHTLFSRADSALYLAKERGRDRVVLAE